MTKKYHASTNQQNKLNSKLYEQYYLLFSNDMINWLEIAVLQRNERLNRKAYKLSPRKGKSKIANNPGEVQIFDSLADAMDYALSNHDIT